MGISKCVSALTPVQGPASVVKGLMIQVSPEQRALGAGPGQSMEVEGLTLVRATLLEQCVSTGTELSIHMQQVSSPKPPLVRCTAYIEVV